MSEAGLPLEIERKFLIALPDAALLGEKSVKRLAIAQVYLRAVTSGAGRRIRRARCVPGQKAHERLQQFVISR